MVSPLIRKAIPGSFLVCVLALLAGCAARGPAPIYDRNGKAVRTNPSVKQTPTIRPATYLVQRGDTLYGIAWRYGVDHKLIAKWNNLRQPFTIYPRQRLRLIAPRPLASEPKPSAPVTRPAPRETDTGPAQPLPGPSVAAKPSRPAAQPPAQSPRKPTATAPSGNSTSTRPVIRPPVASSNKPSKPSRKPTASSNAQLRWRWPTEGRLHRTFAAADPGRKGLDIVGTQGQAIKAAAAGEVVYSGAGLIGYGELIIIKHNQQFLSAYGHNRSRLVKEGEQVVAGQTIAEMGSSGTDRSMLHFEVRRDGQPVDPQLYLPRR